MSLSLMMIKKEKEIFSSHFFSYCSRATSQKNSVGWREKDAKKYLK
jgi:hypothetical protein